MLIVVILVRMKKTRYAWVAAVPAVWILLVTMTAGWQKIFSADAKIGFLAHAQKFSAALQREEILAPAKTLQQMQQVVFNDYVDAVMAGLFIAVVISMFFFALRAVVQALRHPAVTANESMVVWRADHAWREEAIWHE